MLASLARHWPALILALVVGTCTVVPQLIASYRIGDAFQGVHPLVIDDQIYYLARAHETVDGHSTLGNPYLSEYKEYPGVQFWVPDMVLAQAGLLLGSLRAGVLASQFVFPFFIVVLSYLILYALTNNRLLSCSVTAFLVPGLVFIPFLRSPNPQLFVLLLLSVLLLLYALRRGNRSAFFASILLGGALFYVYPFYWTYWVVMVALTAFGALVFLPDRATFYKASLILVGAIILGIPYLLEWYQVMQLPFYHESLIRFGTLESRFPSGPLLVALVGIVVVAYATAWRMRVLPRNPASILIGSAALAGAVVLNQHLITGINYFFTVHYATFIYFMCGFSFALSAPPLLERVLGRERTEQLLKVLCVAFMVFALFQMVPHVVRLATPQLPDIEAQRYGPVLTWLDTYTEKDEVVYANPTISAYIPAYTHNNVLWAPYAFLSYLPDEEVERRYIASHYLDHAFTLEDIQRSELDVFGLAYLASAQHESQVNKLRSVLHLTPHAFERYPAADFGRVASSSEKVRAGSFKDALRGYRIDYLVWDSVKEPDWRMDRIRGTEELYGANGLVVYKLRP
jgi:hypothetical protein